jgi:hypothetical protein
VSRADGSPTTALCGDNPPRPGRTTDQRLGLGLNDDSDDGGHAQRKDRPAVKRSPVAIPPSRLDGFEVTLALITGADRLARHQRDTAAREARLRPPGGASGTRGTLRTRCCGGSRLRGRRNVRARGPKARTDVEGC